MTRQTSVGHGFLCSEEFDLVSFIIRPAPVNHEKMRKAALAVKPDTVSTGRHLASQVETLIRPISCAVFGTYN